jgi:hypothetical protein
MLWTIVKDIIFAGFAVYAIILIADVLTNLIVRGGRVSFKDPRDSKSGFIK